jgi:hypothetical protein
VEEIGWELGVGDGLEGCGEGVLAGWGQGLAGMVLEGQWVEVLNWSIDGAAEAELGHFGQMKQA